MGGEKAEAASVGYSFRKSGCEGKEREGGKKGGRERKREAITYLHIGNL